MSELKAYTYDDMLDGNADVDIEYYPKSEVDETIAELNAKLNEAEEACMYLTKSERHQKYKRCLAMAEWCDAEADVADADGDYEDMRWYQKWHKRWLAIAEKLKEAK